MICFIVLQRKICKEHEKEKRRDLGGIATYEIEHNFAKKDDGELAEMGTKYFLGDLLQIISMAIHNSNVYNLTLFRSVSVWNELIIMDST